MTNAATRMAFGLSLGAPLFQIVDPTDAIAESVQDRTGDDSCFLQKLQITSSYECLCTRMSLLGEKRHGLVQRSSQAPLVGIQFLLRVVVRIDHYPNWIGRGLDDLVTAEGALKG